MENVILENALLKASQEGYEAAYQYLADELLKLPEGKYPRVVYFLMCLAAGSGKSDTALILFEEAVLQKGYWFRKEELEDKDLESLFENTKFMDLKCLCEQRQRIAAENAERIAGVCREKGIKVGIYCGELDEACRDMAAGLYQNLAGEGVTVSLVWQPGMRHRFPDKMLMYGKEASNRYSDLQ